MRTSTLARAGAVVTASALAFSLGAGPASAADTSSTAAPTAPAATTGAPVFSAGSVGAAAVPAGPLRFGSGVITSSGSTLFVGSGQFAGGGGATATVKVKGKTKGAVPVLFSRTPGDASIAVNIPRGWGSGKVQVNVNGTPSNTFYARKQVRSTAKYPLKIRKVNSKITFRAINVKIVDPSNGKYKSVKRIKLQQYRGGTWKTKKTIKLNSSGTGRYKTSIKKKYRYRLYVPRTSTQEKFATIKTKKI